MFAQKLKENADELLSFYARSGSIIITENCFFSPLLISFSESAKKFVASNPFSFLSSQSVTSR